jgi:hypothetical protein
MPALAGWRRISRVVVGAFCLYHMAATLFANMPVTTAFGADLRAPFDSYITYAGLWQNWAMFETIPYFRSIHPVLVAHYPSGPDLERGAMLPGLDPYAHRTRLVGLFLRFAFPPNDVEWFVHAYLGNACTAFEEATGERPSSVGLRLDSERLIPLAEVRRLRSMSWRSQEMSGVAGPCD